MGLGKQLCEIDFKCNIFNFTNQRRQLNYTFKSYHPTCHIVNFECHVMSCHTDMTSTDMTLTKFTTYGHSVETMVCFGPAFLHSI